MGLKAGISIVRPINCAMIGFAVIVGEFVSRHSAITVAQSAFGFLTGFFICAYSMVVNDVYDVEVDRVNQPSRPIPSGDISINGATKLSIAVLFVGMAFAVLSLNWIAIIVAGVYAGLSWFYNFSAKKQGMEGNLIVASSLAIPFIYGGVITGGSVFSSLLLLMALTAFFSGVGREVVKAMADVDGDSKRGINSLARGRGMTTAALVGGVFFLIAVVTSWLPLLLGISNKFYEFGVVVPDVIFVYLAVSIFTDRSTSNAHRVKTAALAGMLAGLLVFIGGGI